MDYAKDLSTLLTGITSSIYLHNLPKTPDNFIGVSFANENQNGGSIHMLGGKAPTFKKSTIEILVAHTSAETCLAWLESARVILDGSTSTVINGRTYIYMTAISDVIIYGRDNQERFIAYMNFNVLVKV